MPHSDQEKATTAPARPVYGGALVQDAVVITLRTDSFECPDCGIIVVATDDRVIDLATQHDCRHPIAGEIVG